MDTIYEHIKKAIDLYEEKERVALDEMEKGRCPLSIAFPEFYNELTEVITEYCEDNDLNTEDYDTEEIFWEI